MSQPDAVLTPRQTRDRKALAARLVIRSGVAIVHKRMPGGRRRSPLHAKFAQMKVGDCIVLPAGDDGRAVAESLRRYAHTSGWEIESGYDKDGNACRWRLT